MKKFALFLIVVGLAAAFGAAGLAWMAHQGQADLKAHVDGGGTAEAVTLSRLSFPSLNTDYVVLNEDSAEDLLLGPAHVPGSADPGQKGNCIIAAHRDTHFSILKNLKYGDEVTVERRGEAYRYRIFDIKIVKQADTSLYGATEDPVLTLVTCYPFFMVGAAPKRYVVRAKLIGVTDGTGVTRLSGGSRLTG